MTIYYDSKEDIFLREDADGDFVVYFPERHETVPGEELSTDGLVELK